MASPVPKPGAERRRRNAHTPHDRKLPVAGRPGPAPRPPVRLGKAGTRWWKWAWSTPQATTWGTAFTEALVKRAELEDLWAGAKSDDEVFLDVTKIVPLMTRLDESFGLTPRSAAAMHLTFEDAPAAPADAEPPPGVTDIRDRIRRLSS